MDFIGGVGFGFPPFVFDDKNRAIVVEFDHVALAGEAENQRAYGQAVGDADAGTRFVRCIVGAVVEDSALGGELVLRPSLLEVDEGALARAKKVMLQGGDGEQLVFGEHGDLFWEMNGVGKSRILAVEANPALGIFLPIVFVRYELFDGIKNDAEALVVFFLHCLDFLSQELVGVHQAAELDESPHDGDVHLDRAGRPEYAGEHGHALFGEGVGKGAASPVQT